MMTEKRNLPLLVALQANKKIAKGHPNLFKRATSHLQAYDRRLVIVMEKYGILNPWDTLHAVRYAHAFLSVCCAMLQMESEGGNNVFGTDPGGTALNPAWLGTEVTKIKYLGYLGRLERGYRANAVGPCQLSDASLQHGADHRGGCWIPLHNMTEGFTFMRRLIDCSGSIWMGFRDYNGQGNAAIMYADQALMLQNQWRDRFLQVK